MQPAGVLESCLYVGDLAAAERFYGKVLGLEQISSVEGRHVFFRCGEGVVLLFNAERTSSELTHVGGAAVPMHGSRGAGHLAFRATDEELPLWKQRLMAAGVEIESEVEWPSGGRSIYFRDPSGNSLEFATPTLWELK
jgi:catechol 2,3-dioxygenase-like lactoylglutathione lyase family enzyme